MTDVENSSEDLPETAAVLSPGQQLAQARERAGISQEQVAQALHMTVSKVRALETDDYNWLNVATFVRGYLRAYAVFLKLDPGPVLAAYEQQAIARGLIPRASALALKEKESGRKAWGFIISLLVALAFLLLISVWFFGNRIPAPAATASLPAETTSRAVPQPQQEVAETVTVGEQTITENQDAGVDPAAESAVGQGAAVAEQTEPQTGSQPTPLDVLHVEFSEECWLEVSDAQGDVLATDLQRAGSQISLQGKAPFQVKLGNAAAAHIKLNGVAVELAPPAGDRVFTVSVGE